MKKRYVRYLEEAKKIKQKQQKTTTTQTKKELAKKKYEGSREENAYAAACFSLFDCDSFLSQDSLLDLSKRTWFSFLFKKKTNY